MAAWGDRPKVVQAMLNPALLAVVTASTASGYRREANEAMPWPMAFVAAPLVLHRGSREALPASTATHLTTWVSRNPTIRAGFPLRARGLVEPVREGIRFGLVHGILEIDGGRLLGHQLRRKRGTEVADEVGELVRKANLLGRWFGKVNSPVTIFAVLGVEP
ncbi:three component ABC system middle component [Protofrankia coriariae]|uniref:three component ABC system middle component n=1 Tax=Protofrankia coriariae TaxID=1562887 RepID=UPI003B84A63D